MRFGAALLVLLLAWGENYAQDKIGCYFDISISNETTYLSDYSLKNMVVKVLEKNLPSEFYRSYNENETFRVFIKVVLLETQNLAGTKTGIAFGIYTGLRTWPINLGFMPEDMTIGVTGNRYDMDFIKTGMDNLTSKVFGQYDELKEIIRKSLDQNSLDD